MVLLALLGCLLLAYLPPANSVRTAMQITNKTRLCACVFVEERMACVRQGVMKGLKERQGGA